MAASNESTNYADILLSDGDIDLSTNSVQIITSNVVSLKQRLDLRFAIWETEWRYYVEYGTPWKSYLGLGLKQAKPAIDQEIKRQVFREDDVINIYNFKSTLTGRLYTCYFDVMTAEGTVGYALNMKDGFIYEIPSYSSGCDKIVEYQYWTSAPYDNLIVDYSVNTSAPAEGSMLDPLKQSDNTFISVAPTEGSLKDSVKYSTEDLAVGNNPVIISMVLTSTVTPDYIAPIEDTPVGNNPVVLSMTLTTALVDQVQPLEDLAYGKNPSVVSMTLTG